MLTQRETVRFLSVGQEVWLRQFPALHRRAQWHLASHLSVRAREGAALGELYGLVKQIFLLDDATVRERVGELRGLGFCALDPEDAPLSARTVVLPTAALLNQYDLYLRDIGVRLLTLGAALAGLRPSGAVATDPDGRIALLRAVETAQETWLAGAERVFEADNLSRARRIDARRHLLSISHSSLLLMALEQQFAAARQPEAEDGLLADQMAASLLGAIRQNFQTTRDHIAYLMRIGLLERRPGRALRVGLAAGAIGPFGAVLEEAGAALARQAGELARREGAADGTGLSHGMLTAEAPAPLPALLISGPGDPPPRIELGEEPLVVGRAPGAGLMLPSIEVSRAHCKLEAAGSEVLVTDLHSTNGTFIDGERIAGTVVLAPGAVLRIGPYRLTLPSEVPDGTIRADRTGATIRQQGAQRRREGGVEP